MISNQKPIIKQVKIQNQGGGGTINIPRKVMAVMRLKCGEKLNFVYNPQTNTCSLYKIGDSLDRCLDYYPVNDIYK